MDDLQTLFVLPGKNHIVVDAREVVRVGLVERLQLVWLEREFIPVLQPKLKELAPAWMSKGNS